MAKQADVKAVSTKTTSPVKKVDDKKTKIIPGDEGATYIVWADKFTLLKTDNENVSLTRGEIFEGSKYNKVDLMLALANRWIMDYAIYKKGSVETYKQMGYGTRAPRELK